MQRKDRINVELPNGEIIQGIKPPEEIGGIVCNDAGDEYMKFEMHPHAPETVGDRNSLSPWVVVKKDSIEQVGQDLTDPDGFFLITKCGTLHIKDTQRHLLAWLEEEV